MTDGLKEREVKFMGHHDVEDHNSQLQHPRFKSGLGPLLHATSRFTVTQSNDGNLFPKISKLQLHNTLPGKEGDTRRQQTGAARAEKVQG